MMKNKKELTVVSKPVSRSSLITALDVGTTKVACLIAQFGEDGELQVSGVGHHRSRGMRAGQIANLDEAEDSIRQAVATAEQMANTRVERVFCNISCGSPRSRKVNVELAVAGHQIRDADVKRILDLSSLKVEDEEPRDLIHCIPTGYSIDGNSGVVDPRGMYGDKLAVTIQLVNAAIGPARNLATAVERCELEIADRVVSSYASGLAVLVNDEKDLGVTVIDMGGGTTSIAVFMEGQLVFVESVAIGGNHVTNDIAKGLSTPTAKAERLKTVHGSVIQSPGAAREMLKVPLVGEDDESGATEIPKSMLVQIMQPRLEETFEHVRNHLEAGGFGKAAGRRVVLTGGASQLEGIRDLAELVLDKQVRLARPKPVRGLAESMSGPAFATAAGLLRYGLKEHVTRPSLAALQAAGTKSGIGRIGRWLRENF